MVVHVPSGRWDASRRRKAGSTSARSLRALPLFDRVIGCHSAAACLAAAACSDRSAPPSILAITELHSPALPQRAVPPSSPSRRRAGGALVGGSGLSAGLRSGSRALAGAVDTIDCSPSSWLQRRTGAHQDGIYGRQLLHSRRRRSQFLTLGHITRPFAGIELLWLLAAGTVAGLITYLTVAAVDRSSSGRTAASDMASGCRSSIADPGRQSRRRRCSVPGSPWTDTGRGPQ